MPRPAGMASPTNKKKRPSGRFFMYYPHKNKIYLRMSKLFRTFARLFVGLIN